MGLCRQCFQCCTENTPTPPRQKQPGEIIHDIESRMENCVGIVLQASALVGRDRSLRPELTGEAL
jgi:hypothetical protein